MTAPAHRPAGTEPVLYTGVVVYSTQDPEASAVLVEGATITWIGPLENADRFHPGARRIDATGCLMAPGFVDSAPLGADAPDAALPEGWREAAASRGIVAVNPGTTGEREGMRVVAPVTEAAPLKTLARDGVPVAFGSAGARQAQDPWSWVRAASREGDPQERLSDRAAFLAATRAGHRLAGRMHPGSLTLGGEATFVLWEPWDLTVHSADEHTNAWSVDPRSYTPLLPDLSAGAPRALRTVIEGVVVHDDLPGGAS